MTTSNNSLPGSRRSASRPRCPRRSEITLAGLGLFASLSAAPQDAPTESIVIIGAAIERRAFDAPYAVGVVDAEALRSAGPMVNLSEALARVPGLTVNLRNNYAQDLQISSRGFGARASFGVRGMRLYSDGIPAAGPDGQGQVSHFDLAGADRIEILRGPFSALYGNSSGGVIALASAAPTETRIGMDLDVGAAGLAQWRFTVAAPLQGGFNVRASASWFDIKGFRPQSAAERELANVRLGWHGERDSVVVVLNALDQPAQDPLGLTRAQIDADPDQTTPQATQFDTRKTTRQTQLGAQWQHRFSDAGALRRGTLMAYAGQRSVTQWQAIAPATQANVRHPGGVIDFDRSYQGVDARLLWQWGGVRLVAGAALDRQQEDRRGFENFIGTGAAQVLGVTGALRREEDNRARSRDLYAQAEFDLGAQWSASLGARHGRLNVTSSDRYLSNGNDSGALDFSYTTPVAALRWQPTSSVSLYASAGRGHESPTLNELAYRPDGNPGFNTALGAQTSRQFELGAKWRVGSDLALDAALFQAHTDDEIGVQTNAGGRSTFQNVGRTKRQGAELALRWRIAPAWRTQLAATVLDARYRDGFLTCAGVPCAAPTVPVPAGNRIAGTSPRSGFAELVWSQGGLEIGAEARGQARVAVNDVNGDFAAGHGLVGLRALWRAKLGTGTLELLARVDNLADRRVTGSVIVNEGNQRFFEPAAGRNGLLSVRWQHGY
jgi:iron complex outermembrane receptor protein